MTVLLTTHYMEEAEFLADNIVVLGDGRILQHGATADVVGTSSVITFHTSPSGLLQLPDLDPAPEVTNGRVQLQAADSLPVLRELLAWQDQTGQPIRRLEVRPASLDDLFLRLARGERP
jgi:ABC-2 type transport system ATP-binding protein